MYKLLLTVAVAASASLVNLANGQAHAQAPFPETVVSATRIQTPSEHVASSVTVITAQDLAAKQYRTLVEALAVVPGLQVVQSGGAGKQTSIFARGSNSNQTLILIDRIEATDSSTPNGAFNFAHLLTADIARIEIVRGPQSTLFGSDAIGAVINITTRLGAGPRQYVVRNEVGSFDTYNGVGQVSGSAGALRYAAGVSYTDTDGESVTAPRIRALQAGAIEEDDGYTHKSLSLRTAYTVSERVEVGMALHHVRTRSETDQPIEDPDAFEKTRQWFGRIDGTLLSFDGLLETVLAAGYTRHTRGTYNVPAYANTLQRGDSQGEKTKLELRNNAFFFDDHIVTLGLESELDSFRNVQFSNFSGFTIEGRSVADARTNAAYVQDQFSFGDTVFGTVGVRLDDHDTLGSKATYRLAPVWLLPERGLRLKGALGTGFRAPALFHLFGNTRSSNGGTFTGDPTLRPEESFGWEVGFEQTLRSGDLVVGSTYFDQEIKNLLETQFSQSDSTVVNLKRADIYGVETFIAARIMPTVTVRLDHTYTRAENKVTGGDLRRRPKHKIDLDVRYEATKKLDLTVTGRFVGSGKDVTGNPNAASAEIHKGSHTLFNLAASYSLNETTELFGRINNLLNRRYETADGLAGTSRGVFVGASVRF